MKPIAASAATMMSRTLTPISVPQVGARSKMLPKASLMLLVAFSPSPALMLSLLLPDV